MKVIYTQQPMPTAMTSAVFLAGPTPRSADTPSWRPAALALLEARGYDGVVFVPEFEEGPWRGDYETQVAWEEEAMSHSDCVLFWVPRELERMPALTTNDEWGWWKGSGKAVFGAPPEAEKIRYQRWWADHLRVPCADTLEGAVDAALAVIGRTMDADRREEAECQVPLMIWRKPEFQRWREVQRAAGNRLERARSVWTFRVGPRRDVVFFWALHVTVRVASEGRSKTGEVIVGRADVSATVLWRRGETPMSSEVVLVREFRSAASVEGAMVHELPAGSSWTGADARQTALDEVREETGFHLPAERLRAHGHRPLAPTFAVHHGHLYSAELDAREMDALRAVQGVVQGEGGSSERTYVEVRTVSDLMSRGDVDWATLGMVLSVVTSFEAP